MMKDLTLIKPRESREIFISRNRPARVAEDRRTWGILSLHRQIYVEMAVNVLYMLIYVGDGIFTLDLSCLPHPSGLFTQP